MKNLKILKMIILFLVVTAIYSCSNDDNDDANPTADLIGEWQRSDFNNVFEYKLIFNADNSGYRTQREGELDGQSTSSLRAFNWNVNEDILNIDYDGEIEMTNFYINSNEQLHLTDLTDLYFIKLD